MIDFDKKETIPISIISLLNKNRELIREELILETKRDLEGHQWKGGSVRKENYNETFRQIQEILSNEKIIGFHCTKLIHPQKLNETGLKKLNPKEYEIKIKQFLRNKLSDKEIVEKIDTCFAEYNSSGEYDYRKNMVWFVINKSLVHDSSLKSSFKYFGGEVIRRVAYQIKDIVFPLLIQTGIPTVVKFEFMFNELQDFHQHNLIDALIESQVFDKSYKYYRRMQAEGYVERDIKPQEIVQIYYDNNIMTLKNTVANNL